MADSFVNVSGWIAKSKRVKIAVAVAGAKVVLMAAQDVYRRADRNLKGPGIHPRVKGSENPAIGQMPVPRRTGTVAKSLKMTPLSTTEYAVWADPNVADYIKYVHDGHRAYTRSDGAQIPAAEPRRFIGDVISETGNWWESEIRSNVLAAIRMAGR